MVGTFSRKPCVFCCYVCVCTLRMALANQIGTKWERLLAWVQEGCEEAGFAQYYPPLLHTVEVRHGPYGRALFAKRSFERGDNISLIPESRLMLDSCSSLYPRHRDRHTQLALCLISERKKRRSSMYYHYVELLPTDFSELPRYWNESDLHSHLEGSHWPEDVSSRGRRMIQSYGALPGSISSNVSWEEFQWGMDVVGTRAMDASLLTESARFFVFPLLDMAAHADWPNVKFVSKRGNSGGSPHIAGVATRRIRPGDPLLLSYFEHSKPESMTNWEAMQTWGFASEALSFSGDYQNRLARLIIRADDVVNARLSMFRGEKYASLSMIKGEKQTFIRNLTSLPHPDSMRAFDLRETLNNEDGKAFMHYLRHLTGAQSDAIGYTWRFEYLALNTGREILRHAISNYAPVSEDAALFGSADLRLRFKVMLRSDERNVLMWWLALFQNALAAEHDLDGHVNFQHLQPGPLHRSMKAMKQVVLELKHDAFNASELPIEFGTVILSLALLAELVCLLAARIVRRSISRVFCRLAPLTCVCCLAASSRLDKIPKMRTKIKLIIIIVSGLMIPHLRWVALWICSWLSRESASGIASPDRFRPCCSSWFRNRARHKQCV